MFEKKLRRLLVQKFYSSNQKTREVQLENEVYYFVDFYGGKLNKPRTLKAPTYVQNDDRFKTGYRVRLKRKLYNVVINTIF